VSGGVASSVEDCVGVIERIAVTENVGHLTFDDKALKNKRNISSPIKKARRLGEML
jgi:hypothetical protein